MNKAKKIVPALTVILAATALSAMPEAVNANANSGPSSWRGVTASGAVITGENCPLEVESEVLTFNIPDFIDYSSSKEQLLNYGGNFSAEYTFKNPTENAVTATLAFPFGTRSDYGYYEEGDGTEEGRGTYVNLEDALADKYKVFVGGEEIAAQTRHTFHAWNSFDFTKESGQIYDGYRPHEFFSLDLPVYMYKFNISSAEENYFEAELTFNTSNNMRLAGNYGSLEKGSGKTTISYSVKDGDEIDLYTIGEALDVSSLKWEFYRVSGYWGLNYKSVKARAELSPKMEIITFEDYVFEGYPGGNGLIKSDYYNAVLDYTDCYLEKSMLPASFKFLADSSYYMSWLVYGLNLDAGQTVKNTVTAPIFPGGYYYYDPTVYTYGYLLSPAQGWSSFKSLEVRINTPYYLFESNLQFEKTDYGCLYKADGLPEGELSFELCTVENPVNRRKANSREFVVVLISILAIPAAICLGFAIWGIAVLATGGKKQKKKTDIG